MVFVLVLVAVISRGIDSEVKRAGGELRALAGAPCGRTVYTRSDSFRLIRSWNSIAELNDKSVERRAPVVDRHGPLLGNPLQRQIVKFEQRFLVGKDTTVFTDLTQRPIQRLNGIGRIKNFANVVRIFQKSD